MPEAMVLKMLPLTQFSPMILTLNTRDISDADVTPPNKL